MSDAYAVDDANFVCVIRKLLDPEELRPLRLRILKGEKSAAGPSLNPRAEIQGVASDALRVDPRWYEAWARADLAPFLRLCRGFDQLAFPPQIRHVRQEGHFVPWHQDLAYQKSMGARGHREVATCFVPLDDEPSRHSTIEFALTPRQKPVLHVDAGIFHNALPQAEFAQRRTFDLALGDVLFFGSLIPHRTVVRPGQVMDRVSMEFRLTRRGGTIAGKDYFDLETRRFYVAKEERHEQSPT